MDIRVHFASEEILNQAVELIQMLDNNASISTWEPDGDDENDGTYGAFVDGIDDQLATTLGQLYEVSTD